MMEDLLLEDLNG